MRHRAEQPGTSQTASSGSATATATADTTAGTTAATTATRAPGRHRAAPRIPRQLAPRHEASARSDAPEATAAPSPTAARIPEHAGWRGGSLPRLLAVTMLVAACLGTTSLAVEYADLRSSSNGISLALGVAVIVGLWGLLIASSPQVVQLSGSILTIKNSRGVESFDLANGLQPVDLVGDPTRSQWALLLHRLDGSTLVLRRRDVDAVELDRIVRHYRRIAERSRTDRDARFDR